MFYLKKEVERISCISRKGSENSRSRSSSSVLQCKDAIPLTKKILKFLNRNDSVSVTMRQTPQLPLFVYCE